MHPALSRAIDVELIFQLSRAVVWRTFIAVFRMFLLAASQPDANRGPDFLRLSAPASAATKSATAPAEPPPPRSNPPPLPDSPKLRSGSLPLLRKPLPKLRSPPPQDDVDERCSPMLRSSCWDSIDRAFSLLALLHPPLLLCCSQPLPVFL